MYALLCQNNTKIQNIALPLQKEIQNIGPCMKTRNIGIKQTALGTEVYLYMHKIEGMYYTACTW